MQDKKPTFFGQIASLSDIYFFLFLDAVSKKIGILRVTLMVLIKHSVNYFK